MSFVSEIEAMFFTGSVKWNRAINEKDCVVHVMFFEEAREKLIREHVVSCRFKLCMEQIV